MPVYAYDQRRVKALLLLFNKHFLLNVTNVVMLC